jgi:N-acetylglutamate synthase-like GNAT family acetyltransferase
MIEIINLKDEPVNLATLAAWHQQEWSSFNPGESIEERILRMQPYLNEDFIPSTFIAKDNGLSGSAAIVSQDMETSPQLSPWLASVYVPPEKRGRGIGTKLVLHVMAQAKREGIKTLYLFTPDRQGFYLNLGWSIKNVEQYQKQEVTIMQVDLDKFG